MANIRKCIICAKSYEYCPNCAQNSKVNERWKLLYCSEDCKNVSDVINKYGHNHITELEAQEKLSPYNLDDRENYVTNIKNILDKIFSVKTESEQDTTTFKSKKKNRKETIVNDDFNVTIDKTDENIEPPVEVVNDILDGYEASSVSIIE